MPPRLEFPELHLQARSACAPFWWGRNQNPVGVPLEQTFLEINSAASYNLPAASSYRRARRARSSCVNSIGFSMAGSLSGWRKPAQAPQPSHAICRIPAERGFAAELLMPVGLTKDLSIWTARLSQIRGLGAPSQRRDS